VTDEQFAFAVKFIGGPTVVLGVVWGLIKLVGGEAYRRATAALTHIDELREDAQKRDLAIAVLKTRTETELVELRRESDKHREALHQLRTELGGRLARLDERLERD